MADLIGGQVQMVFGDVPGVAPHIRSGAVRPLAARVTTRITAFPEVPTMAESDPRLADYDVYTWAMLVVPKATPDAPVRRLHEAAVGATRDPGNTARLAELGFDIICSSPEEGDAVLAREQAKWDGIIRQAGIRADS
jgi:tripartite-type tricarboxylate transporter receptor subunit TctC